MAILSFEILANYDKLIRMREEINRLQNVMNSFDASTPEKVIKQAEAQLSAARAEMSRLTLAATEAGTAIDLKYKKVIEELTPSLKVLKDNLKEAEAAYASLQESISNSDIDSKIKEINAKISKKQGSISYKENELETLSSPTDTEWQERQRRDIEKLREEITQLTAEKKNMLQADIEAGEQYTRLGEVIDDLKARIANFGELGGLSASQAEVDSLVEAFGRLRSSANDAQQNINSISTEAQGFNEKAEAMKQEIADLATQYHSMNEKNSTEDERAAALDRLKEKLNEQASLYAQANAMSETSYNAQVDHVKSLEKELDNLTVIMKAAAANGDNANLEALSGIFTQLSQEVEQAKVKLDELKQKYEDTQKQMAQLPQQQAEIISPKVDVEKQTTSLQKFWMWAKGGPSGETDKNGESISKFSKSYAELSKAIDGLGLPMSNTVKGLKSIRVAMAAMMATPLGLALSALALAFAAVNKYLHSSAEGQKTLNKISALTGSVMKTLGDVVIALGKIVYSVVKTSVQNFQMGYKNLRAIAGLIGDIIGGIAGLAEGMWDALSGNGLTKLSENWDKFKTSMSSGVKDIQSNISNFGTQLASNFGAAKDAAVDLYNAVKNSVSAAQQSWEIAGQQKDTEIAIANERERQAQLDIEIAKNKEKIYTLTGKEKDEAIKLTKQLIKQKYEGTEKIEGMITLQTRLNDLTKKQNDLHVRTLEDIGKEREGRIKLLRIQAQEASATRFLTRQEESNRKKMENEEKQKQKKATTQAKKDATEQLRQQKAEAKYQSVVAKNAREQAEQMISLEESVTDARIAAMQAGAEKVQAEKQRELDKELEQLETARRQAVNKEIERQKAEYEAQQAALPKGSKYTPWDEGGSMVDQAPIDAINVQYNKLKDYKVTSFTNEQDKQEHDALRTYLKDYGTYQEQRLAIAEEYAEKIRQAQTEGERLTLTAQRDDALQKFDNEQMKKGINWEQLFGDVNNKSVEQLQSMKDQLRQVMSDSGLSVDDYSKIAEQIDKINNAIIDAQDSQKVFSGLITEHAKTRRKLEMEVAEAMEQQTEAAKQLYEAQASQGFAQQSFNDALQKNGLGAMVKENISVGEAAEAVNWARENYGDTDPRTKALQSALDTLTKSSTNVKKAQDKLTQSTNKLKDAQDDEENSKNWQESLKGFIEKAEKVVGNINELPGLLDKMGLGDTAFGESVANLANGANSGLNAAKDFMSGNYVGAVSNAFSAVDSFGSAFGLWGVSDKTLAEDMERLSEENENLANAISKLTDVMEDATIAESGKIYEQQIEAQKQTEENLREEMQRNAAVKDKSSWFHNGTASSNYKINQGMTAEDWEAVSKAVGKSVTSGREFFQLSSEEMYKVMTEAAEQYVKIKGLADDGYGDAAQFMDEYAESWKQLEELTNQYYEHITSFSYDDVVSQFTSALSDIENATEVSADNVEEMLRNAIINGLITNKYKPLLEEWYQGLSEAIISGGQLTQAEADEYRAKYLDLTNQAKDELNTYYDVLGIDSDASSQQSGTSKTFEGASQDQMDEANGRMTAIQSNTEQQLTQLTLANASLTTLIQTHNVSNEIVDSIRDTIAKSYLELQSIRENTEAIIKPIQNMSDKMDDWNKTIKAL